MLEEIRMILDDAESRLKDRPISASASLQGNLLTYKIRHHTTGRCGAKRGEITDFSRQARLRMLKHMHRIDFASGELPLFITLTYPDELATPDLDKRNVHRKVFARHLERLLEQQVGAAWRVEWVDRKSGNLVGQYCPHWHLLVFGIRFIPYQQINDLWKKTIGWDDYVRTEIKRVDQSGAINLYMAKYIAKDAVPLSLVIAAYQSKVGRSYGWLRKSSIPLCPETYVSTLTDAQRRDLSTLAVERLPLPVDGLEQSFTLMGDDLGEAGKILGVDPLTSAHPTR